MMSLQDVEKRFEVEKTKKGRRQPKKMKLEHFEPTAMDAGENVVMTKEDDGQDCDARACQSVRPTSTEPIRRPPSSASASTRRCCSSSAALSASLDATARSMDVLTFCLEDAWTRRVRSASAAVSAFLAFALRSSSTKAARPSGGVGVVRVRGVVGG